MAEKDPKKDEVISNQETAEEKRVRDYWTEERMKNARPIPMPSPDDFPPAKPEQGDKGENQQ